jgi:hypothetical protein
MIDLKISQQFGRLGLEIRDASYELNVVKPKLELRQKPAELHIKRTDPEFEIDYKPLLESLGYGDIGFITARFVQQAQEAYLQGVAKTVALGQDFAAIQHKTSIGDLVFKHTEPAEKELTLQPLTPLKPHFWPGTLQLAFVPGGVEAEAEYGKVSLDNFVFPSVRAYLEQKPELRIEAVGQIFDQKK